MKSLWNNPYVKSYLDHLQYEKGYAKETILQHRAVLNELLEFLVEEYSVLYDTDFLDIHIMHIRKFIQYLKVKKNNSNRNINSKYWRLHGFFRYLTERLDVPMKENPMKQIRPIQYTKKLPQYMTIEEVKEFLQAAQAECKHKARNYSMFLVFVQTGIRISELAGLRLQDCDLNNKTLRVLGKGNRERMIPLLEMTAEAIRAYLKVRSPKDASCRHLFLNHYGRAYCIGSIERIFHQIMGRTQIQDKKLTVHSLRHTCLTLLLQGGANIRVIKELAGHNNIRMTQIYLHVAAQDIKKGMQKHPLGQVKEESTTYGWIEKVV